MKVTIGQKEFEQAESFGSPCDCPMAIKLKELFPDKHIIVLITHAYITDGKRRGDYYFKGWSEKSIELASEDSYPFGLEINEYIKAAKKGEEVPTFEVEIIGLELN